jgi:hypothetical protein
MVKCPMSCWNDESEVIQPKEPRRGLELYAKY